MSNMMLRHNFNSLPMNDFRRLFFSRFPGWNDNWLMENTSGELQVDVKDSEVCVKFPFPGCTPKDFEVEVVGDYLTVKAHHSAQEQKQDHGQYICRERSSRSCQESVKLPVKVIGAQTKAKYKDGVLVLYIPRETESVRKGVRTIQVD